MLRTPTLLALIACALVATSARAEGSPDDDDDAPETAPDRPAAPPLAWDRSKDGMSVGLSLHRFQDDFGLGGTVTTPQIAHWIRFTAGAGVAWYPHALTAAGTETWEPFEHARLVVEVGPGYLKGVPIRPYGFGGAQVVMLPSSLSTDRYAVGGLGGFGFELAFARPGGATGPVTYYAELGGIGMGAHADKLPENPGIANGFLISTGFRAYL